MCLRIMLKCLSMLGHVFLGFEWLKVEEDGLKVEFLVILSCKSHFAKSVVMKILAALK